MGPSGRIGYILHILDCLGQDMQVLYLGRAPRTKETLPDFLKWRRVTRPPLVFRGLTSSQRTPGFWGVTINASTASPTQSTDTTVETSPPKFFIHPNMSLPSQLAPLSKQLLTPKCYSHPNISFPSLDSSFLFVPFPFYFWNFKHNKD